MSSIIKFLKFRDVKSPQRQFGDAGIDFFIPNYSEEYVKDLLLANVNKPLLVKTNLVAAGNADQADFQPKQSIVLPAHCGIKIPSGIRSLIDPEYVLMFTNKSGVALRGLDVSATTVDASYQGEINLCLVNTTDDPITLNFGDKIVQAIIHKHYAGEFDVVNRSEITEEEFYKDHVSHRGTKGFGQGTGTT